MAGTVVWRVKTSRTPDALTPDADALLTTVIDSTNGGFEGNLLNETLLIVHARR